MTSVIPVVTVDELKLNLENVTITAEAWESGNTTLAEQRVILSLLMQVQPEKVFEFGTFNGRTTVNMAANCPNAVIYTLDLCGRTPSLPLEANDNLFITESPGARFHGFGKNIVQLCGDSALVALDVFYGKMDFVFVDGAHSVDYTLNDSLKALEMVSNRGVIVWHDYGVWRGVTQALDTLYQQNPRLKTLKHILGEEISLAYWSANGKHADIKEPS